MKSVNQESLTALVESKPILMLKHANLGYTYVREIICQSADDIATKQGSSRLPKDVWLNILDFALEKNEDY